MCEYIYIYVSVYISLYVYVYKAVTFCGSFSLAMGAYPEDGAAPASGGEKTPTRDFFGQPMELPPGELLWS